MKMRIAMAAGAALLGLLPGVSMAEGWIVTVGARMTATPPYEGAGHDVLAPIPSFSLRRADTPYRFTPPDDSSSIALLHGRYADFGPVVRFRYSRGDEGQLTGLNKVGWAAEPGAFLNLWPTNWLRGRVEARHGAIGHYGWVGDAGVDAIYTGSRWQASLGPRIGYGDSRYFHKYFGVTLAEANRSPLIAARYEPDGGRRYTGVEAALGYRLFGGFRMIGDFGYHRLSSAIAQSPIIQVAGSRDQFTGSVGLTYSFGVGH